MIRFTRAGAIPRDHSAPNMVFVHGALGTGDMWKQTIAALQSRNGPLHAWTAALPGHGPRPERISLETSFMEIVQRGLSRLPFAQKTWIVGYSMGARLALGMLLTAPERFFGAVLTGVNPGIENDTLRTERALADEQLSNDLRNGGIEKFVATWESNPIFASQRRLCEVVQHGQRTVRVSHDASALADALCALSVGRQPELWSKLSRLCLPVLAVSGNLDSKFADIGRRMAALSPQIQAVEVPCAGHNAVLEQNEKFVELVGSFIARGAPETDAQKTR